QKSDDIEKGHHVWRYYFHHITSSDDCRFNSESGNCESGGHAYIDDGECNTSGTENTDDSDHGRCHVQQCHRRTVSVPDTFYKILLGDLPDNARCIFDTGVYSE